MTTDAVGRAPSQGMPVAEQVAAGYFALQALAGLLLWVGADASDVVRSWLEVVVDHPEATNAFRTADVVVIVSSTLAAWGLWGRRPWAIAAVWFTVGGIVYPTVFLGGWVATTDGTGEVALAMMLLATVVCCSSAVLVWQARPPV